MATPRKGSVVKQVLGHLAEPIGPGDPGEISWVQAQRSAFAKYLAKEWALDPDLDRIYVVALRDVNRDSREKLRERRSTPEGKARAAEASRRSRERAKETR